MDVGAGGPAFSEGLPWGAPILPGLREGWRSSAPPLTFPAIRLPASLPIGFAPAQFPPVPLKKLLTTWYSCDTNIGVVRSP